MPWPRAASTCSSVVVLFVNRWSTSRDAGAPGNLLEQVANVISHLARFSRHCTVALSVVPFGIAYGAIASQGMALWQGWLMSVVVFAGTAQFVTASMVSQETYVPILVTALLLNLRLVLLSAAVSPHVRQAPKTLQPLVAHMLTDESFAVSMAEFEQRPTIPGSSSVPA